MNCVGGSVHSIVSVISVGVFLVIFTDRFVLRKLPMDILDDRVN